MRPGRVFTIPAGVPFLETLAEALTSGRLVDYDRGDPLALAGVTVLLPTRRATRAFRDMLVRHLSGDAAILPAIRPIGDVDEEDHLLAPSAEPVADRLALPAAVTPLERRLSLTQFILAWGRSVRRSLLALAPDEPLLIPASAADAARLAGDLARLLDDIETAGVPWQRLRELVPADHAGYYQITLDFLKIIAEQWPAYLAGIGLVDPIARRDMLIRAAAQRLSGPVVAAGSTGSIPATAALLKAISRHDQGAVVLPGLDQDMDAESWEAIGDPRTAAPSAYGHPQFGLKQLIGALGILREDVVPLSAPQGHLAARQRLVGEALRPAETTDRWVAATLADAEEAMSGIALMVAHNEREEALAVALALREVIETPGATAALVTPDRAIARRVAAELGRWGLDVDDSAGLPLDGSPEGIFARLMAEAALSGADPVIILALAKHPLAAFGMSRPECRRAARMLEIALFRGHRVVGGVARLGEALAKARVALEEDRKHASAPRRRLHDDDWQAAGRLVAALGEALGPIERIVTGSGEATVAEITTLLRTALNAAATDDSGANGLETGAGGALAGLLDGLAESQSFKLRAADYPELLRALMAEITLSRPGGSDPRIHIWGTLEARLQSIDLLVLGGLDEGVWPAATRTDPFLSRAMRGEVGLPPPERRLGQAAHDFVQGALAPRVIISRAEKRGGTPSVESRWLQRLEAIAGEPAMAAAHARGAAYVELARAIDWVSPGAVRPIKAPQPKPPLVARPASLSVTEIETLVRDPYAIYAKHVLRLDELEPLGQAPDYALRGSLIHAALGEFITSWSGRFDAAATEELRAIGRRILAEIQDFPDIHAIWSFRFDGIARWLVQWEAARDSEIAQRHAEISGQMEIPVALPGGVFRLRGRADRIDQRLNTSVDILDFKTGTPPSARQLLVGLAPQLGLEAAMVRAGGFGESFRGASIATLAWIGLSRVGRDEPVKSAVEKDWTADEIAEEVMKRLKALLDAFADPERAYVSRARPMFETRYESPYDHLARVREWGLVASEEDQKWFGTPTAP
jgi:ATP-dependent helicase/nuclease subunit B